MGKSTAKSTKEGGKEVNNDDDDDRPCPRQNVNCRPVASPPLLTELFVVVYITQKKLLRVQYMS